MSGADLDPESSRLDEDRRRVRNWTRWGPYLAERQWGTVREDYSADGDAWTYLTHDQARSRCYRWGEDGLLGLTDRQCRLCFAVALWNGRDPILKERLFGLDGHEGNHGEDVKELYYYLDATPTSSYLAALYKYPQAEFPYARLVDENRRRSRREPEFNLEDTGVFDDGRYWDVQVEYAKASPADILIRFTCANRGPEPATLHVLPSLWLRNTWGWGRTGEGYWPRGRIGAGDDRTLIAEHPALPRYRLDCELGPAGAPRLLFTDNETNLERLYQVANRSRHVKDAFHRRVVNGEVDAVNPDRAGTKAAAWYQVEVAGGAQVVVRCRLRGDSELSFDGERPPAAAAAAAAGPAFGPGFDQLVATRRAEADRYYARVRDTPLTDAERQVVRQADAGLIWSRQFYHYIVEHWLDGDPGHPPPPPERRAIRNRSWPHLWARDVIPMPDTWEYPWFAAWDTAFHCVAMARTDPAFAKHQLLLMGREWYQHPSGQFPAYEYSFDDVNPPVHAWAAWRIYQLEGRRGGPRDRDFLERAFQKCLINFTWWVNREDLEGDNLFTGGFLGLDNIGVFDRSKGLPSGARLEQADATAWMAFYCTTMLAIALELAVEDRAYGDVASKFFEHFVYISLAINQLGGTGLWDERDGFYYDVAFWSGHSQPLRLRSMVGLVPLFAVESLGHEHLERLPLFRKRMQWFLDNRPELARTIACLDPDASSRRHLLAIPTREKLIRVLRYMFDEREFLSPHGIRSMSRIHLDQPFVMHVDGEVREVRYTPGESDSAMFGGNSNWRGPIWFPVNYLLVEALKRFHHFYKDTLAIECPTGSGRYLDLGQCAEELERRLVSLFLPGPGGHRPCHGGADRYASDPHFRDLVLFHEYFEGDTGRGLGANHQTGWTALAGNLLERVAAVRARRGGAG